MALTMFTRSANIRNIMKLNNISAVGGTLNVKQHLNVSHKSYTVSAEDIDKIFDDTSLKKPDKGIRKVMRLYVQRSKEYHEFLEKEIVKYDLGKRHLANMMGEDPDQFNDEQISKAIEYLLPSGLYDWRARPLMMHPSKLYERKKEAQFDESGRPFHFLFYTCKPNYYSILYDIADSIRYLNRIEDMKIATHGVPSSQDKFDPIGTDWFTKEELEATMTEEINTTDYEYFIKSFVRVIQHPMSNYKYDFIMKYRHELKVITQSTELPPMEYDSNDRPFVLVKNCKRKNAHGDVKVLGNGSGKFTINGQDITYFKNIVHREQIIFPLIFANMSDKVDIEANINGGGPTGQSGAIRWGIAQGLRNFVDIEMIEKMRLAGLLTRDWRRRERKKWGQEGARRKFTWKKR